MDNYISDAETDEIIIEEDLSCKEHFCAPVPEEEAGAKVETYEVAFGNNEKTRIIEYIDFKLAQSNTKLEELSKNVCRIKNELLVAQAALSAEQKEKLDLLAMKRHFFHGDLFVEKISKVIDNANKKK